MFVLLISNLILDYAIKLLTMSEVKEISKPVISFNNY